NVRLTAYGLMEFTNMAKVHDVDPRLLERTRKWLLSKRQADGTWDPDAGRMHLAGNPQTDADFTRLACTAYVAWAVFGAKADAAEAGPTLDYIQAFTPRQISDPHVLALVANALLALDPSGEKAAPYVERLEFFKKTTEDGKLAWWAQEPMARTMFHGAGIS